MDINYNYVRMARIYLDDGEYLEVRENASQNDVFDFTVRILGLIPTVRAQAIIHGMFERFPFVGGTTIRTYQEPVGTRTTFTLQKAGMYALDDIVAFLTGLTNQ